MKLLLPLHNINSFHNGRPPITQTGLNIVPFPNFKEIKLFCKHFLQDLRTSADSFRMAILSCAWN